MSFIGEKKLKSHRETKEKTAGGFPLIEVQYEDEEIEWFSSLMFEKIVSDKACDLSELRDKRISPLVEVVLASLRDWGIKISELPYFSVLLNNSLDENTKQAYVELWSEWGPRLQSPDEASLIQVDKVLRAKKKTLKDVLK